MWRVIMTSINYHSKQYFFLALLCISFIVSGCSNFMNPQASDNEMAEFETPAEIVTLSTTIEGYTDIEIPFEMKIDENKAIRTSSFKGGIHTYAGKVEINSLRDYIITSMDNHKWKLVAEAYYDGVLLTFVKPNKTCMIEIYNGTGGTFGKTYAKFYVAVDLASANKLNPFGEPTQQ